MTDKEAIKNKFASFFGTSSSEDEAVLSDVETPSEAILFSSSDDDDARNREPSRTKTKKIERKAIEKPIDRTKKSAKLSTMDFTKAEASSGEGSDVDAQEEIAEEEENEEEQIEEVESESDDAYRATSYAKRPKKRHADLAFLQKSATPRTSKKSDLDTQVRQDEKVAQLVQRMNQAAEHDFAAMESQSSPATQKYLLLQAVLQYLSRRDMHESLLEQGICTAIRYWLEPYADGTLPGMDIRKGLLEALLTLPVDMYHLKESGLGKVVKTLSRSPHETKENKNTCQKLIYQWSTAMLGQEMDYRALTAMKEQESRRILQQRHRSGGGAASEDDLDEYEGHQLNSPPMLNKPFPLVPPSSHSMAAGAAAFGNNTPEKYKKLLGHMQKLKSTSSRTRGRK